MNGGQILLGFLFLIALLYLFIVILARFNASVRKFTEFLGFNLVMKGKPPPSGPATSADSDQDRPKGN